MDSLRWSLAEREKERSLAALFTNSISISIMRWWLHQTDGILVGLIWLDALCVGTDISSNQLLCCPILIRNFVETTSRSPGFISRPVCPTFFCLSVLYFCFMSLCYTECCSAVLGSLRAFLLIISLPLSVRPQPLWRFQTIQHLLTRIWADWKRIISPPIIAWTEEGRSQSRAQQQHIMAARYITSARRPSVSARPFRLRDYWPSLLGLIDGLISVLFVSTVIIASKWPN